MVTVPLFDPVELIQAHYQYFKYEDATPNQIKIAKEISLIGDPETLIEKVESTFKNWYGVSLWTPTVIGLLCNSLLNPEYGGSLVISELVPDVHFRSLLCGNFDVPLYIKKQLVLDPEESVRVSVAKRDDLDEESYLRLAADESDDVIYSLLDNLSIHFLSVFETIRVGNERVRRALVFRKDLPVEIQMNLASDDSVEVLKAIRRSNFVDEAKTLAALRLGDR